MNSGNKPATLLYGPNGFRVVKTGDHVLCAVTGMQIPLEELRYWCVDRQEAYAGPAQAAERLVEGQS